MKICKCFTFIWVSAKSLVMLLDSFFVTDMIRRTLGFSFF